MNISVIGLGFALFLCGLSLHVLIWRLRHPKHQALSLFAVFLIPCPLLLILATHSNLEASDMAAAWLLHIALSCAYIQTYPALQGFSPSLVVLLLIGGSPGGITRLRLASALDEKVMLEGRIQDVIDSGWAREEKGSLIITPSGSATLSFFLALRRLMGLPMGTG